jgi:hypothetical protein
MPQDADYWKRLYQQSWAMADQRERAIIERIQREAGKIAIFVGLGAGSADFLSGTAASQGFEKGGADLQVVDTNTYLEVTGPQVKSVTRDKPLWLRPDKIDNARAHPEHDTWVVHWLERDGTLRVIHLDQEFFQSYDKKELPIVTPRIRGAVERYVEIPAQHRYVQPWAALIGYLKKL